MIPAELGVCDPLAQFLKCPYPPLYTMIELATGTCHGAYDSMADVALCLAFAKPSREEVEVIVVGPPLAGIAAWE